MAARKKSRKPAHRKTAKRSASPRTAKKSARVRAERESGPADSVTADARFFALHRLD